jgi:hypothetical protein
MVKYYCKYALVRRVYIYIYKEDNHQTKNLD